MDAENMPDAPPPPLPPAQPMEQEQEQTVEQGQEAANKRQRLQEEEKAEENVPLPPTVNYKSESAKNFLGQASNSDAQHDVPTLTTDLKNPVIMATFGYGLPGGYKNKIKSGEWGALNSVFHSYKDPVTNQMVTNDFTKKEDKLFIQRVIDDVIPDVTNDDSQELIPLDMDIGIPNNTETDSGFGFTRKYSAVSFTVRSSHNSWVGITSRQEDDNNIGQFFCKNTDLLRSSSNGLDKEAIFVVDNAKSLLSQLKMGGSLPADQGTQTIHIVTTSQGVNDPGPRPNPEEPLLFKTEPGHGVDFKSWVQMDTEDIVYSAFDPEDYSMTNNFWSTLNYSLSPIQQIFGKKTLMLNTTLNVSYNENKQEFKETIPDSKIGNSNAKVLAQITSVVKSLLKSAGIKPTPTTTFKFNSNLQRKRGGDWWQVLCCSMIYLYSFYNIVSGVRDKRFDRKIPAYFVTHDQIAVSYALAMGCNVIFLDNFGRCIVFKNLQDFAFATDGPRVDPNELYLSRIQDVLKNNRESFIEKMTMYQQNRSDFIEDLTQQLNTEIGKFLNFEFTQDNFTTDVKEQLKPVFQIAVKLAYALKVLSNIETELALVQNKDIVNRMLGMTPDSIKEADNLTTLQLFNRAYYKLVFVEKQLSGFTGESVIETWVDSIEKQRVYRSINTLFEGTTDSVDIRSLNSINEEGVAFDKHIFLSFIQNLNDGIKKSILDLINGKLIAVTNQYKGQIAPTTSTRRTQDGIPAFQAELINNIFNFVLEVRHFLYVKPQQGVTLVAVPDAVPEKSSSTTSILVDADFKEISKLEQELSEQGEEEEEEGESTIQDQSRQLTTEANSISESAPATMEITCEDNSTSTVNSLLTGVLTNNYYTRFKAKVQGLIRQPFSSGKGGGGTGFNGEAESIDEPSGLTVSEIEYLIIERHDDIGVITSCDDNFGYHPLLPLYMILSSFWYSIDTKLLADPEYEYYTKYFYFLKIMVTRIIDILQRGIYEDRGKTNSSIITAYMIGFALKSFLFSANANPELSNTIQALIMKGSNKSPYDYSMMKLLNSSFSTSKYGTIYEEGNELEFSKSLLDNEFIGRFICDSYNGAFPSSTAAASGPSDFGPPAVPSSQSSDAGSDLETETETQTQSQVFKALPLNVSQGVLSLREEIYGLLTSIKRRIKGDCNPMSVGSDSSSDSESNTNSDSDSDLGTPLPMDDLTGESITPQKTPPDETSETGGSIRKKITTRKIKRRKITKTKRKQTNKTKITTKKGNKTRKIRKGKQYKKSRRM